MRDKPPEADNLSALLNKKEPELEAINATVAALKSRLEESHDRLLEERFIWTVVLTVMFDAYVFTQMVNWAGALVIGVLELIAVAIMADRCGVDTVAPLIDRLTGFVGKTAQKKLSDGDQD